MRFWGGFFLSVLLLSSNAWARARGCAALLGNPVRPVAEREKVRFLSNDSLLTVEIGTLQKGKSALLNEALELAAEYGIQVKVVHTEAVEKDPFFERAAVRVNEAGAFSTPGGDPVLVLGSGLIEEFAVHEVTHLKDYVKTVRRYEARGLSREKAMAEAALNNQETSEHYAWEKAAVVAQLKSRYQRSGFQLWDHGLIERLGYPELSVLVTRHLALRGTDGEMEADGVMDRAIWKALIIQRLRHRDLLQRSAVLRAQGKKAEAAALDAQAKSLRSARALFDQLFPSEDLAAHQISLVQGLFVERLRASLPRLRELKENSFLIDAD